MADKRIQDLTPASSVQTSDRFVLEQSGQAKSLTGQILINDLAAFLDGHGGINDISYTPPASGSMTGTLTVTLADGTAETFTVTNGRGITSFTKTGTSGLVDTYRITYNDGSTPTEFTVTNGRGIASFEKTGTSGLEDTYEITYNDGSEPSEFTITNGRGIESFEKTGSSGLDDTYEITYNDGSEPSEFTVSNGRGIESIGYVESVGLDDYYQIDYNDGESTSFIVHNGEKGDTGDNWYVHIKWAAVMPTQDSDMVNIPSDFIGIYAGIGATAPTAYTDYDWYDYKGEKGDTGTSISSVAWQSSSGLVDTYRVNFDDGTSTTFNVTNGSNISSITKTSTVGLVDTYVVTLTNGNQTTFQVNNGKSIVSITWTSTTSPTGVPHVPGATDTYTVSYNDGDSTTFQVYNGLDGEGASITVDGIPSTNGNVPLLTIDTEHGAPTPLTQGSPKSRYFDAINSVLYICLGYDENNGYIWRGAGVTVDSALSTSSTNPVQNRAITNKIGTAALDTTAQDLSGAVNEILDDISGFADNLADEYDATATYAVGDLCLHDNTLYRCNTAIATPEAWNSIHWTATSVDEELDGKVSKAGDTMTGVLYEKTSIISIGDTPSTNLYPSAFVLKDANEISYGGMYGTYTTANNTGINVGTNRNVNGTQYYNWLGLLVGDDGSQVVTVSNQSAWRNAINAVNKSGDTMTGMLKVESAINSATYFDAKNTAYSLSDLPSGFDETIYSLVIQDKANNNIGYVRSYIMANGSTSIELNAQNLVSGSGYTNGISLVMKPDGTRVVSVTSPTAWRSALGLGTSGTLPITVAQGGTGVTQVLPSPAASNIVTVASGITISSGSARVWGKICQINLVLKNTSAVASGTLLATLKDGYKPAVPTNARDVFGYSYFIDTSGRIEIYSAASANSNLVVRAFYLLP